MNIRHTVLAALALVFAGSAFAQGLKESVKNLGRYAASWIAGWPKHRPALRP